MLIDDSAIAICDLQAEALFCYDLDNGSALWVMDEFPNVHKYLHGVLPDEVPDYARPFGKDLRKVGLDQLASAEAKRMRLGSFDGVHSFDIWSSDSLVIASQARYPYRNNDGRYVELLHTVLIVTNLANRNPEYAVLVPSMARNSTPVSNDVVRVNRSVWLTAWDYDPRVTHPDYLWSEKYDLLGKYQGVSSSESVKENYQLYRQSIVAFSAPFQNSFTIRSMSRLRCVDVMNTDDGSYVRHSLPELVNAYFDTLASYTSGAVVLGEQRVAVRVSAGDRRGDVPRDLNMVVLGTISRDGSSLVWTDALTFEGPDMLMGLVQTHRSPRYASSLLVIMQNKEKGFYVARVDQ
jgi:hypothetical protein